MITPVLKCEKWSTMVQEYGEETMKKLKVLLAIFCYNIASPSIYSFKKGGFYIIRKEIH